MNKVIYDYCAMLFYLMIGLTVIGWVTHDESLMALASFGAGSFYALRDYCNPHERSLNVMTFYALFAGFWFGISNYAGFWAEGTVFEPMFFDFEVREFFFESQVIASFAIIFPPLVYDTIKSTVGPQLSAAVPHVGFEISDQTLLRSTLFFLPVAWLVNYWGLDLSFLGTLASFIGIASYVSIFILSTRWLHPEPPQWPAWTRFLPFIIALGEASYAAIFSAQRSQVAWPLIALTMPYILRRRLNIRRVLIGGCLLLMFAFSFKQLAETRRSMFGAERIDYAIQRTLNQQESIRTSDTTEADEHDTTGVMRLLARLSTFNQLTQIIRLTDQEGFYEGENLGYVIYVFIPRVLWADKPLVAPGQWFASKLGRGTRTDSGGFSNAINMTIPGELYLNFGWIGVTVGLFLMTLFYFLFWEASRWGRSVNNILSYAFAFSLIYQAVFNGSHLGGFINLIIWYILYMVITYISDTFIQTRRQLRQKKAQAQKAQPPGDLITLFPR